LHRGLVDITGHDVEVVHAPKRPGDIRLSYLDCSKAEEQLGWKAEVDLEEGLRYTVGHFGASLEL
jgi:UDP-glucose 4-epimerase